MNKIWGKLTISKRILILTYGNSTAIVITSQCSLVFLIVSELLRRRERLLPKGSNDNHLTLGGGYIMMDIFDINIK